jgi:dipeptidase E
MPEQRLLLLSNSRNYQKGYLEHAGGAITGFLGGDVTRVLFVPYAGVTVAWDTYEKTVAGRFAELGYEMRSIHREKHPVGAVREAQAIAVGGGNTFHLLKTLYEAGVMDAIRERVRAGAPYMGWSAGSNVACPTIRTTNDMPVVQPPSFDALALVPFQINPHYTDAVIPQHQGETRADRLAEFIEANPGMWVVGLLEGGILRVEGGDIRLLGEKPVKIFRRGEAMREVAPSASLAFLME